jgi:hypothetical protein
MVQFFNSHTKKDKEFCDDFDRICVREGIQVFRSEFEEIEKPAWESIKNAIDNSVALFVLIGKELVESENSGDLDWRHTQNWIAFEIGLACKKGIDVWAVCDDVSTNYPIPYINNYLTVSLKRPDTSKYLRAILKEYKAGKTFPAPTFFNHWLGVTCYNCGIRFNLHVTLKPGGTIICPQCLKVNAFKDGIPKPSSP